MAGWKQNDKSSKKEELQKNSSSFSYIHIIIIFQVPLPQLAFFSDVLSLVFLLVPLLPLFLASLLVLVPLPFSDDLSLLICQAVQQQHFAESRMQNQKKRLPQLRMRQKSQREAVREKQRQKNSQRQQRQQKSLPDQEE